MDRIAVIEHVRTLLSRAGFAVSERCDLRPVSFDLVARRDRELLVLKVLGNVDALGEAVANEIKLLARFLEARPLIVGLRSGTGDLEPGVVYARYDIPILRPETLHDYLLAGERPMVFAAPGGFYVRLHGQALRDAREAHGLSLGMLAQVAGVSRRAIQMYEEGMNASIDAAMRLEEFLQRDLIRPMDPFDMAAVLQARAGRDVPRPADAVNAAAGHRAAVHDPPSSGKPTAADGSAAHGSPTYPGADDPMAPAAPKDPMEALVRRLLEGLGYEVRQTKRSPFDALSSQGDDTLLTGMGRDSPHLRRRIRVVADVGRIIERPAFFVVERAKRTQIEGVPVVDRQELRRLTDPDKVLELILARRG